MIAEASTSIKRVLLPNVIACDKREAFAKRRLVRRSFSEGGSNPSIRLWRDGLLRLRSQ
jgi:hypothetical protein